MAEELDVFGNKKPETPEAAAARQKRQKEVAEYRRRTTPMSKRQTVLPAISKAVVGGAEAVGAGVKATGKAVSEATTPLSKQPQMKGVARRRSIKALEASEKSGAAEDARIDTQQAAKNKRTAQKAQSKQRVLANLKKTKDDPSVPLGDRRKAAQQIAKHEGGRSVDRRGHGAYMGHVQEGVGTPEEVAAKKTRDKQAIAEDAAERKRVKETGTRHKPGTVGYQRWQQKQKALPEGHTQKFGRAPDSERSPGEFQSYTDFARKRDLDVRGEESKAAMAERLSTPKTPKTSKAETMDEQFARKTGERIAELRKPAGPSLDIAGIRKGIGGAYTTAVGAVKGAASSAAGVLRRTAQAAVKDAPKRAAKARRDAIRKKRLGMSRSELLQAPGASRTQVQRGRQLDKRARRATVVSKAQDRRRARQQRLAKGGYGTEGWRKGVGAEAKRVAKEKAAADKAKKKGKKGKGKQAKYYGKLEKSLRKQFKKYQRKERRGQTPPILPDAGRLDLAPEQYGNVV